MSQSNGLTDSDPKHQMSQLDRIERKLGDLDVTLRGDGRSVVGIVGRLDRVERAHAESQDERKWFKRTVGGAALLSVVAAVAAWLKGGAQ